MKTEDDGVSSNIEDRRGSSRAVGGAGLKIGAGGGGIVAIIIAIISIIATQGGGGGSGFDLTNVFQNLPQAVPAAQSNQTPPTSSPQEDQMVKFVSFVLDDLQTTWAKQLQASGLQYREAKLVLFHGGIDSGCGPASADMGPFYCPADEKVYLDLDFFQELATRFQAPGDFAQAYVIAHEVGHHIQKLTGTNDQVTRLQQQQPSKANDLSIRLELQADCYAGVWAYSTYQRNILESGDLDEGLRAATAVGDDYIQKNLGSGRVNPETWTHGSSEQRTTWFRKGYDSGDPSKCDTFSVKSP
jgi:predicted metalloprotease